MEELDDVVVAHNATTASLRKRLGGNDSPVVVGIVVAITSDLLTLTADSTIFVRQRVPVRVGVKEDLGVLVTHRDDIVVVDV